MIFCTFYFAESVDSIPTTFACEGECICDCVAQFIGALDRDRHIAHDEFLVTPMDDWSSPVWHKLEDYLNDN